MGSPTGAAGGERGMECSRGIAHRRCLGRGGDGLQPWDRPQAPQERGEGGAQPWDHPHVQRGGGGREGRGHGDTVLAIQYTLLHW